MQITVLKSKIHRARITGANLDYEGSISIDKNLLDSAGIMVYERVQVVNLNNGSRFETYVIEGKSGSGEVALNGPAARLGQVGDQIIIMSYAAMSAEKASEFEPTLIVVDPKNRPI